MKKVLTLIAFLAAALCSLNAQVVVSGDITTNTTWFRNNTYLLSGFVYVADGATLTIEPGTTIKGDKASKGTLIVSRGGKIIADGTPSEPIVFTSNEASPSYGDGGVSSFWAKRTPTRCTTALLVSASLKAASTL